MARLVLFLVPSGKSLCFSWLLGCPSSSVVYRPLRFVCLPIRDGEILVSTNQVVNQPTSPHTPPIPCQVHLRKSLRLSSVSLPSQARTQNVSSQSSSPVQNKNLTLSEAALLDRFAVFPFFPGCPNSRSAGGLRDLQGIGQSSCFA